ncbi:MAG: glycosyltransferase, partial [Deltaproteobacteria bacterium]|nr:glycosyltransferase [Deltaproteobacteria bacterium]
MAAALKELGHSVHVITEGIQPWGDSRIDNGVMVHELPIIDQANSFSPDFPNLNGPLTYSQAVYERLLQLEHEAPFDMVDFPLWMAEGFVTLKYYPGPAVVSLQTTLFQIIELQERAPTPEEMAFAGLDKECLAHATGVMADSGSILEEIERLYGFSRESRPHRVVPLGLPPLPETLHPRIPRPRRSFVEALVVGRLEVRKGTQILFDVLPEVLRQEPKLKVRFVGKDNSANDGFFERTGRIYAEYFRQRHPDLSDQVIFEGYVPDERLNSIYAEADFHLLPSLYESFGLAFLEGMRSGLPTITFENGGACEVFENGEADGGILLPVGDKTRLARAILRLSRSRDLRTQLGQRALDRFLSSFQSNRMAKATADFYWSIRERHPSQKKLQATRVFQVMEALAYGDAVSNIARRNASVLAELGGEGLILSLEAHEKVAEEMQPLETSNVSSDDGLIFHYWNFSRLEGFLRTFNGPKAVHYHNMTPPHYFSSGSVGLQVTSMGYGQLERIADWFDLIIGDSDYNVMEYGKFLKYPKPAISIPPIIDAKGLSSAPFDGDLYNRLREPGWVNFLFVGRVVPNKRQDLVMQTFEYYYGRINRYARLFLVGDLENDPGYFRKMEALRREMVSREQIIFTGKVPDKALRAFYRAADVFVCASEHEGFCIPLV